MTEHPTEQIRTALFVDFDNIYLNLTQLDGTIAYQFATSPDRWLAWLERGLPLLGDSGASRRRVLIRRCYLNPQSFSDFRPYFIRSAFEVIDCPPLTTRGKTSTDIHMVMDILDALGHATHFQEFIILSGDADFTPVLLRLRVHNRYSAVLSAGYVSPAYKAACDYVILQDVFVRDALGISYQEEEPGVQAEESRDASAALLRRMAGKLYEAAVVPGGVEASKLPGIYKEFLEFRQSIHWLGFFSLRRLTEAIVAQHSQLELIDEDPWRVVRSDGVEVVPPLADEAPALSDATQLDLKRAIAAWVRDMVGTSQVAVPMASLAQGVRQQFGSYVDDSLWLGAGSFKGLLAQLDLGTLRIAATGPGFIYDPGIHEMPSSASAVNQLPIDNFLARHPDLAPLARNVHRLTDTPYLVPEHYALLLTELAREINERGYQMSRVSKTVRDRCVERGAPVARSHVNFILAGIGYAGYRLGQELPESAERLGEAVVQNTINLCRTAQLSLSDEETEKIRSWIVGALHAVDAAPQAAP